MKLYGLLDGEESRYTALKEESSGTLKHEDKGSFEACLGSGQELIEFLKKV